MSACHLSPLIKPCSHQIMSTCFQSRSSPAIAYTHQLPRRPAWHRGPIVWPPSWVPVWVSRSLLLLVEVSLFVRGKSSTSLAPCSSLVSFYTPRVAPPCTKGCQGRYIGEYKGDKKKLFALLVLGYLIRASAFGHGALPRIRYFPLMWVYVINPSHASRTFWCHVVSLAKRFSFVSLQRRLLTSFLNSSSS